MSPVSTVDGVTLPGMTSSATAPLTTRANCARHVCGVWTTLVSMEFSAWTYKTVMSVSNHLAVIITFTSGQV